MLCAKCCETNSAHVVCSRTTYAAMYMLDECVSQIEPINGDDARSASVSKAGYSRASFANSVCEWLIVGFLCVSINVYVVVSGESQRTADVVKKMQTLN